MVRTTAQGRANAVRRHRQLADLTRRSWPPSDGVAVEVGDYAPSVYLALRLAQVLRTSVETLFTTDQEGQP